MIPQADNHAPFRLDLFPQADRFRLITKAVENTAEKILGFHRLTEGYRDAQTIETGERFPDRVLQSLEIGYEVSDEDRACIPETGPVVIVANHPFGAVEGIILASILQKTRPDTRIMANYLLSRIPEMRDMCIFVDPFHRPFSARRNTAPMREALNWLRNNGVLVVFPAGTVSHAQPRQWQITDPEWNPAVARLAQKTGAAVVPVYFDGSNGPFFQAAGLIHNWFRTALLPRNFLNKRQQRIHVRIGEPIKQREMTRFTSTDELTRYFRLRTYILNGRARPERSTQHKQDTPRFAEIASGGNPGIIAAEVDDLSSDQILVDSGEYTVFHAISDQIPAVIQEIGRLREITFREVGEGTGMAMDLDQFDQYYTHLVLWNRKQREIAGAYRLGRADEILRRHGRNGLYSTRMFHYKDTFFQHLDSALELGRSFIRREYQRSFAPLMLLWKGIATYVSAHPRYRYLFGLVSISQDYTSASRTIIRDFLREHLWDDTLTGLAKPRNPFLPESISGWNAQTCKDLITSVDDISALVSEIESDGKGIPILLKQYIKLGGRIAGFNVDKSFSDVLDGLIVVDLAETEQRTLGKYMGAERARQFRNYHRDLPLDGYGMHVMRELIPAMVAADDR